MVSLIYWNKQSCCCIFEWWFYFIHFAFFDIIEAKLLYIAKHYPLHHPNIKVWWLISRVLLSSCELLFPYKNVFDISLSLSLFDVGLPITASHYLLSSHVPLKARFIWTYTVVQTRPYSFHLFLSRPVTHGEVDSDENSLFCAIVRSHQGPAGLRC